MNEERWVVGVRQRVDENGLVINGEVTGIYLELSGTTTPEARASYSKHLNGNNRDATWRQSLYASAIYYCGTR